MPPPGEPCSPSCTAGLSEKEAADADEDYLYFLQHVRLDGDAYSVVIPSEDGASSPPQVIRYEQPLPDHNAGTPVAGSNCGEQMAPPSPEESPCGTSEASLGVKRKRKAPDASPGGEVRSGAVLMEEDTPTPVAEPAWLDSPDIDDDYRFFLRHVSQVEDKLVFKMGNCSITIGEAASVDHSDAEEEEEWEEEEEEEEEGEGEDQEDDEVDSPASGQSGEDGIGEEEAISASVTEDGVDSDLPIQKVKEEDVSKEDDDYVGTGSELQIVNEPVYYETEKPLNALVRGTTDLDPLGKKEASTSKGHLAMPLNASELQGVIWPPHINERPNSVFKEKLIEFLIKPFTQEEYDDYFALATDRRPLLKERRTRNKVAYYPWTHELNKSYFDRYPDLAEQFSLQCNNYPNGLALLRGLIFWLQNVEQEGQFRPWSDGFKKYRVVPFVV